MHSSEARDVGIYGSEDPWEPEVWWGACTQQHSSDTFRPRRPGPGVRALPQESSQVGISPSRVLISGEGTEHPRHPQIGFCS